MLWLSRCHSARLGHAGNCYGRVHFGGRSGASGRIRERAAHSGPARDSMRRDLRSAISQCYTAKTIV